MIKSCENIETLDEFYAFGYFLSRTYNIGLIETASIRRWDLTHLISPVLFEELSGE